MRKYKLADTNFIYKCNEDALDTIVVLKDTVQITKSLGGMTPQKGLGKILED